MRQIIKTNDGYMVELPNGDYLCDVKGDNLFDTFVEASALAWGLEKPSEEQIKSAKANKAFYAWEMSQYGGDSDLSDDHRIVWVKGYLQALEDAK